MGDYLEISGLSKLELLSRLIDSYNFKLSLVFCNTKKRVDELTAQLQSRGYLAEALHGDLNQVQRDRVMSKFRKGIIDVLIATDVAARGIDVNNIEAVFNYDLPNDEEYYVHRIGRTARAGKAGKAFTLVSGRELYKLKEIQRFTKTTIQSLKPPTLMDVEEIKINKIMDSLKVTIAKGQLSKYVTYIEKLLENTDLPNEPNNYLTTLDLAAALLKTIAEQRSNPENQSLDWDDINNQRVKKNNRARFRPTGSSKGRSRKGQNENYGKRNQSKELLF